MANTELLIKKYGFDLNWIFLCLSLVISRGFGDVFQMEGDPGFRLSMFEKQTKNTPGSVKNFTGLRVREDSNWMVYHHGQTVAVVEVTYDREMFNCELLEVRTEKDKAAALSALQPILPKQMKIPFSSMLELMRECQKLDPPVHLNSQFVNNKINDMYEGGVLQFASIFKLIFPGTKWCGTGDIAGSYYDLGIERQVDKCCRTHDFCPIKIPGSKTQYNITNNSKYTKSHCDCDDAFYNCLKSVGSSNSNLVGHFYFNVARVSCVEDDSTEFWHAGETKLQFSSRRKRF